ncbi:SH3 domain-containing protein [Consotaella aegiceratis]|uniref:SH3 domain-containing protein n=1 Tax=Consotaella aegiceratis TaxID=3097961 RepID=UPI002F3E5E0B
MLKRAIAAIVMTGAVSLPAAAWAQASAIATADVNLRAGPSTRYPVITVVRNRDNVTVYGCLQSRSWCDVGYYGARGWMSSNYLAYLDNGRRYTGAAIVPRMHAPIVTFSFGNYWDRYYRDRPFYRDRDRWDDHRGDWDRHDRRPPPPRRDRDRDRDDRRSDRDRDRDRGHDRDRDRDRRDVPDRRAEPPRRDAPPPPVCSSPQGCKWQPIR